MIEALARAFDGQPLDVFVAELRRRLQALGVSMLDGQVIAKPEAAALAAQVLALVGGRVLPALGERPGDALRVLDAVRATGFDELEPARAGLEAERARRFPPPPAATWRELTELRALADLHPAHCQLGPPATHVEFAVQLRAAGSEVPGELLAFYAAASHLELSCRHVTGQAGGICAGDALRIRDGRLILFDRKKRHPVTLLVEQPGVSIVHAIGTWWLVLEDELAPAVKRPLDLQAFLRFAVRRMAAPSLEVLLTDLSWRQFFA